MRPLLLLVLFALVSLPAVALGQATIQCTGVKSAGDGGFDRISYSYQVTPGGEDPVYVVIIGTDDGNALNYTDLVMPDGWSLHISANGNPFPHALYSNHGSTSDDPIRGCPYVMIWDGHEAPQSGQFTLSFNHPNPAHNVAWVTTRAAADWNEPVGGGEGPIHAPLILDGGELISFGAGIPTVSEWGLIILGLLLLAAAVVVIRRRAAVLAG